MRVYHLRSPNDTFYVSVLHEIKNDVSGDVLLAGVFDGHAGTAASESVSKILPTLFNEELTSIGESKAIIRDALERSWERTCNLYRNGCEENGECVVDYDPVEGILYAETGSADLVGESRYFRCLPPSFVFLILYINHSFMDKCK